MNPKLSILSVSMLVHRILLRSIMMAQVSTFSISLIIDLFMNCKLKVDLKRIPASSWMKGNGPYGIFHEVSFELILCFESTLSFKFACNGVVRGTAEASYI